MDRWRYYDLTHARHDVMNPMAPARLDELGDALRLEAADRVLDVACGHAELLLRWHARFGVTGVGLDASPFTIARARRRVAERAPGAGLELVHARGEEFAPSERFDVACCVGASWIWGGHAGTLRALTGIVRPGGAVVTGEVYWKEPPPPAYLDYLRADEPETPEVHDLATCHRLALDQGLSLVWFAGSADAEWDRYELLQSAAVDEFARTHPDDPDLEELVAERRRHDAAYLAYGRRCLGWALWAFRVPR